MGRGATPEGELVSIDPSLPERIVGRVPRFGTEAADGLAQVALAAFPAWRATQPQDRARVLFFLRNRV